jgi:RNA-binding protein Musashi
LKKYFEETCGEVEEANVMMDAHTNRSRGFGFVKFKNPASVNTACHQRIHVIDNKKVDPKPAYVKGSEAEVQDAIRQTKIFIGGLPQDATEDEVRSHFSKFGTVS